MREKLIFKLFKAIELIGRPQGATYKELSRELEISHRSAVRLIETMELELNFPIYEDKIDFEKEKRWKFDEDYLKKLPNMKLPDLNLSLSEIIALHFIRGEKRLYRGTDIERAIDSAFRKLGVFLPEGTSGKLDKIKSLFITSSKFAKDYSGKEEIIDALSNAMLGQKLCHVKYHSFYDDRIKEFSIAPLHFFEDNGGLYLFVQIAEDIRILAVERIDMIKMTADTFEYPADFNPEERLETAFRITCNDPVEAKIWFSADQARYVRERKWAKEQRIEPQPDGSIILWMKTSGMWDLKRWVLSWGAAAKVLEPVELRNEIIKEMKAMLSDY